MQFSIKTLLAITLAAAVVCGVFFALPDDLTIAGIHLLYTLTLPVSIAGVVYGRRAVRAFFLGCLVSVTPFALMTVTELADEVDLLGSRRLALRRLFAGGDHQRQGLVPAAVRVCDALRRLQRGRLLVASTTAGSPRVEGRSDRESCLS